MGATTYAYIAFGDALYEEDVRRRLACVFDLAVRANKMRGSELVSIFVSSGLAAEFEERSPAFVSGMSGSECFLWMLEDTGLQAGQAKLQIDALSEEYWVGYMLALFQMRVGCRYADVFERMSFADLREMHAWCNDLSEEECLEEICRELKARPAPSRLATLRRNAHLTQSELAERVSISTRTVQQYEQGVKDINKAAAETVYRLSLVLGCHVEDLLIARFG